MQNKRRDFLKKGLFASAGLATAGVASACQKDNSATKDVNLITNKKFKWKMLTTWPPNFPILGEGAVQIAEYLKKMSSGRLDISVYGAGQFVPALESIDAVTQGSAEMCHGAAYYWQGKMPAAVFFAGIPFGFNAQQITAWFLYGGGLELWHEIYATQGLIAFPVGNTGVQMAGWFNKEINELSDVKGLKMRIPGIGGKVVGKAGGAAVTMAGGELYMSLERGVLDATEWISPYHDYTMGFHKIAKYYYYPGWHEPGTALEMMINKQAYESLPADLKQMIRSVCIEFNNRCYLELEAKNHTYLNKILEESKVELRKLPDSLLNEFKSLTTEVLSELTASDPLAKRAHESMLKFKKGIMEWGKISEQAIFNYL